MLGLTGRSRRAGGAVPTLHIGRQPFVIKPAEGGASHACRAPEGLPYLTGETIQAEQFGQERVGIRHRAPLWCWQVATPYDFQTWALERRRRSLDNRRAPAIGDPREKKGWHCHLEHLFVKSVSIERTHTNTNRAATCVPRGAGLR